MGTTSSFFGGGGGGSTITTPSSGEFNNLTFLNNTTYNHGASGTRGKNPSIFPLKDNMFFLAEGDATSNVYISLWTINDDGSCTNTAPAIQLSSFDFVGAGASNGIDRLMVAGGHNNTTLINKIFEILWDGNSTISTYRSQSNFSGSQEEHSTVGCLNDGTLLGLLGGTSGSNILTKWIAVRPTGTSTDGSLQVYISSTADTGKTAITGSGGYYMGINSGNSNYMTGGFLGLTPINNSSLVSVTNDTGGGVSNAQFYAGSARSPHMFPLKSGAMQSQYIDGQKNMYSFIQTSHDGGLLPVSQQYNYSTTKFPMIDDFDVFANYQRKGTHFVRQCNGSYLMFSDRNVLTQGSHQVVFDNDLYQANYGTPFANISINASGASGITGKTGTAVVGNYMVLAAPSNALLYLNVWKMN